MKTISAFCISLLAFNVCSDELPIQDLDVALQNLLDEDQRAFYGIPTNFPVPKPFPKRKPLSAPSSLKLDKTNFLYPNKFTMANENGQFKPLQQYPKPFATATVPGFGPPWAFVKNITLIPLTIKYESSGYSAIPDSIYRSKVQGFNCSLQDQTIKGKIYNSYKSSRNAVVNSNIKSDSKFSLGFPIGNTGATIGFDKTFSVAIGQNITTNQEVIRTDEDEINQVVPPNIKRTYYLERIVKTGYYFFDGTVLADGDVSPNPDPDSSEPFWGVLSQLLKNPELKDPNKRTFHVSGYTWNASAYDKNYYWIDEPLTSSQCTALVESYGQSFAAVLVSDNQSQSVISPLFNNMMVETGDAPGEIYVRAKSSSSASCDITFSTISNQVNVKALPNKWSDWVVLTTHDGHASYSVDYTVHNITECSTPVEPQIKYLRSLKLQDPNHT
ncbi:hypothetical protein [Kosakonia radicincitans]|uniref:hypothetical protein n=1 Tax=Kosakonia radicincitans TaxID=283686 RepID=UPI000A7BBE6C|nr:hypothetical protein [Kosakonia radicincitans]